MKQILATLTLDTNGQIVSYQSHGEMTLEEFQAFSEEALSLLAKKKLMMLPLSTTNSNSI
jgi:hypothetical protein